MDTKRLRQRVLDLAIHGKLVPQNPQDEPASELLKRIAAEKERLIKEGIIRKGNRLPEQEWPYAIPTGWTWCILDDFAYVASGSTPSKDSFVSKGIPYLKMYNLRNQKIDFYYEPQYIKEEVHNGKLQRSRTEVGDLIMNIVGPPLGKLAIIPDYLPQANFNQAAVLIRPVAHKDILVKYLFYYLQEMSEIDSISTKGSAGQVNISLTQSQNMRIPLPPLAEQHRIVSEVEKYFSLIDILEESENDLQQSIQKAKSKILDLAIKGKLIEQNEEDEPAYILLERIKEEKNQLIKEKKIKKEKALAEITEEEKFFEIPKNWIWCRWGDLSFSIQYGYNAPAQDSGEIRMVRISDIQNNEVLWDTVPFCNIKKDEIDGYLLQPYDILFARTGGTVGKSFLVDSVPYPSIYAGYLIRTRYSRDLVPKYLKYFMESHLYWEQLRDGTIATAQPNCNGKTLGNMILPLPPLAEQHRIVAKIEELFTQLDNIAEALR